MDHSSVTEREIDEEQRWFLSGKLVGDSSKVGQLVKRDKVAQLCCVSDRGLSHISKTLQIVLPGQADENHVTSCLARPDANWSTLREAWL